MLKRSAQLLAIIFGLALGTGPALAAETITISPSSEKLELKSGESYSGTFKVVNQGTTDFTFKVYAAPYSVSGEDYTQSFVLEPGTVDVTKWFTFDKTSYAAKPHQTIVVPYHLQIPVEATPGGHYAVLFAQTQTTGGAGVSAKKQVGSAFYIAVQGPINRAGQIESFKVPAFQTNPPLHSELRQKNTGNTHYDADINVEIKDLFGNTKAIIHQTKLVMPKTIRKIPLDWDKSPGFGLFKVTGTVKHDGVTEQLPARYTLMMSSSAFVVMFLLVLAVAGYAYFTRERRGNVSRRR